jgi:hypothetical protein
MVLRPSIVIPGIQGSALENLYPIVPATTWSTLIVAEGKLVAPKFEDLALADHGRADRDQFVVSRASQLLAIAYAPLTSGLQGRSGVPAYLFAYDWRYSIVESARTLVGFVERLLCKDIPTIPGWNGSFDFACHSMGGLIFRQFLAEWAAAHPRTRAPVGKVVFIATPHKGSLDAAAALITGETPIFGGQKAMRKLARTFPAVYELLPLPGTGVMRAERGGVEIDLFVEQSWQRNTTSAVPDAHGFDVEQRHLDDARAVLQALPLPFEPRFAIPASDLLVVYGAKDDSTLARVEVGPDPDRCYRFDTATKGVGDDVVLVGSAQLPGVASVAIEPEDVSYFFHPIQRAYAETNLHAFLPAIDEVQTIVHSFFDGLTGEPILPMNLRGKGRFSP